MIILDWRGPNSLGNVVGTAYATEYIHDVLHEDIGIIPAEYHLDVYKLCLPANRIFTLNDLPSDSEIRHPNLIQNNYNHIHNLDDKNPLPWMHNLVASAYFPISFETKVDPKICWLNSRHSRKVLIYPREHNNKNIYFDLNYWVQVCQKFIDCGWQIVAILHENPTHRDGNISVDWCNELRYKIGHIQIIKPTIEGLQQACSICELSFGIFSGPFWMLLKSTIKQVVISDPNDTYRFHHATYNIPFLKKEVIHIPDKSLEMIAKL